MSGAGQFEALGIMPELVYSLEHELHWDLPRPIQEEAIPLILGGGDVLAAAETGSGKTGAFALPMSQIVYESLREMARKSAGAVAGAVLPAARMSAEDKDAALSVSADGLRVQSRLEEKWAGGRAAWGVVAGQYYYEVTCADEGLSRVGWSQASASLNLGTDDKGYGFGGTGKKSHRKQFDSYGVAFGRGNTVGCYLDLDAGTVHFSVDGVQFPAAFTLPPKTRSVAWYPACVLKNAELHFNFGATPFRHAPPAPYRALADAVPEHTTLRGIGTLDAGRAPLALIIEPSRELAEQTHTAIETFVKHLPPPAVKCALLVGGGDARDALRELRGGVDVVTGTLGRIEALVSEGKLSLGNVRFFVLDEADKLMDKDNFDSIVRLYQRVPKDVEGASLQVLMFSATLHSPEIKAMAETICRFPQWIDLKGKPSVPDTVDHALLWVDPATRDASKVPDRAAMLTDGVHARDAATRHNDPATRASAAVKVLKLALLRAVIDTLHIDQALIFTRTRLDADNVHHFLRSLQPPGGAMLGTYSSMVLHAGKRQDERRAALDAFKRGDVRFLISTDVAARGIDIDALPFVINFTLPERAEDYIHRIGRTGRADKIGLAVSLVSAVPERVWFHTCPSRGKNCANTALVRDGGCTIWYDERALVQELEALIGKRIPVMGQDLSLPDFGREGTAVYGTARANEGDAAQRQQHLQYLRPVVEQLSVLEDEAQKSFLSLQLRFASSALSK